MQRFDDDRDDGSGGSMIAAQMSVMAPKIAAAYVQATVVGTWRVSRVVATAAKPMGAFSKLLSGGLDNIGTRQYGAIEGKVVSIEPADLPGYSAIEIEQRMGDRVRLEYIQVPNTISFAVLSKATKVFLLEATMTEQALANIAQQDRFHAQLQGMAHDARTASDIADLRRRGQAARPTYVVTEDGRHILTSIIGYQTERGERVSLVQGMSRAAMPHTMLKWFLYAGGTIIALTMFFLIFPLLIAGGMFYFGHMLGKLPKLYKSLQAECEEFIRTA